MDHNGHIDPQVERLIRLALAHPDRGLIRRLVEERTTGETTLRPSERAWVEANLRSNPSWQAAVLEVSETDSAPFADSGGTGPSADAPVHDHLGARSFWPLSSAVAVGMAVLVGLIIIVPATRSGADYVSVSRYVSHLTAPERRPVGLDAEFEQAIKSLLKNEERERSLLGVVDDRETAWAAEVLTTRFAANRDAFQRAELSFMLAKAALLLEDDDAARVWLRRCIAEGIAYYSDPAAEALNDMGE